MSEFDDPILRDRLSRYAGAPPDSDAVFLSVQQRVRRVKRRRIAIWSGAAALVIGVSAANALRGPDGANVTVPPTASTPVANTVATSTSTTSTSTTSTSTTATSTPATTTTAVATTAVASTQPVLPEVTAPETALGNPNSGDAATAAGAPPTEPVTAPRPTALPAAGEEHHRSATGGTVAIRLLNGSLSVASATPSEGYTVHVDEDSGSRIRVVFERRGASSMVTATLVDGGVRFRVLERGGDQDDAPRNGDGGDDDRDGNRDDNRDNDDRDDDDDRDNDDRDDDRRDRGDDGAGSSRDRPRGGDTDDTDD